MGHGYRYQDRNACDSEPTTHYVAASASETDSIPPEGVQGGHDGSGVG